MTKRAKKYLSNSMKAYSERVHKFMRENDVNNYSEARIMMRKLAERDTSPDSEPAKPPHWNYGGKTSKIPKFDDEEEEKEVDTVVDLSVDDGYKLASDIAGHLPTKEKGKLAIKLIESLIRSK